jgi:hypothetical protein
MMHKMHHQNLIICNKTPFSRIQAAQTPANTSTALNRRIPAMEQDLGAPVSGPGPLSATMEKV